MNGTRNFRVVAADGKYLDKNKKGKRNKVKTGETIHISLIKVLSIVTLFVGSYLMLKTSGILNSQAPVVTSDEVSNMVATVDDNIAATVNVITNDTDSYYTSSGVILSTTSENGIVILTAKHGIYHDKNTYTEITFIDGHTYAADHLYYNKNNDYAIVTIDIDKIDTNTLNVIKTVKYSSDIEYRNGDKVYTIGKHKTEGLLFYEGEITSPDISSFLGKLDSSLYELKTDFSVIQGTSGGGVFNEDGVILGICVTKTDDYTNFIPIYSILETCEENNYLK